MRHVRNRLHFRVVLLDMRDEPLQMAPADGEVPCAEVLPSTGKIGPLAHKLVELQRRQRMAGPGFVDDLCQRLGLLVRLGIADQLLQFCLGLLP